MPGVEFVPEPEEERPAARHGARRVPRANPLRRVPRRVLTVGGAVLIAAVVAAVVVTQRPGGDRQPAAARTGSHSSTARTWRTSHAPTPAPSPTVSTLALPEALAFGPQTTSVLAVGNRIFGVTTRLVGAVDRDGGALVVRPTTAGLMTGTPTLVLDAAYSTVWTVGIGGTSIGSFGTRFLSTRDDQNAPATIRSAAAYGGQLWFVTASGLYRIAPGWRAARLVLAEDGLAAVAADPTRRRVLAAGSRGVQAFLANGKAGVRAALPIHSADDIAVAGGDIWLAGHQLSSGELFHLDPRTLHATQPAPTTGSGGSPRVLATYSDRLVVSGVGAANTMSCLDAASGKVLQTWPYELGAVALDDRGMLVSRGYGIETRSARDCLAGAG